MSTVTKFTFDLDFDAPEAPEVAEIEEEEAEPEEIVPTFSEEELERARAEGVETGREEGRLEAADATEQKLLETIENACAQMADVYNTQTEANRDIAREMISVSTMIAKKMFPDLNARNALGEVERVVQETLKAVTEEPRIQIMVNPELREPLTERLGTMTHRAGFEGKVFVNPDPAMALGDCRIEWSNGAAVRDGEELWEMIEEIIENNLHGTPDIEAENDIASTPDAQAQTQTQPEPEPQTEADTAANPEPRAESAPEQDAQAQPDSEATVEADPESLQAEPGDRVEPVPESDKNPESDEVTAAETPSWEAAMGESNDADATAMPEAAADMTDAALQGDDADNFHAAHDAADTPSFTPSSDAEAPATEEQNTQHEQELNHEERDAPIPHIDDVPPADSGADSAAAKGSGTTAQFTDPDPVSPATQAAILDAQSAMDDDDHND